MANINRMLLRLLNNISYALWVNTFLSLCETKLVLTVSLVNHLFMEISLTKIRYNCKRLPTMREKCYCILREITFSHHLPQCVSCCYPMSILYAVLFTTSIIVRVTAIPILQSMHRQITVMLVSQYLAIFTLLWMCWYFLLLEK